MRHTYGTFREPGLEALGHDCGAEGSKGSEGGETHNDSGVECGRRRLNEWRRCRQASTAPTRGMDALYLAHGAQCLPACTWHGQRCRDAGLDAARDAFDWLPQTISFHHVPSRHHS
jgi:hypothetical protein